MSCSPAELDRVQRTQAVRVMNIVLIGPLMLMGGLELEKQGDRLMGGLLSFFAISTIAYNAKSWYTIDQATRREKMRMRIGPGPANQRRL